MLEEQTKGQQGGRGALSMLTLENVPGVPGTVLPVSSSMCT